MSATVIIYQEVVDKIGKDACKALGMTGKVLQDDVREEMIVPRKTGFLQNESFFVDTSREQQGIVVMKFTAPYAERLYFHPEYHFNKTENPNAQAYWLRPWTRGGKYQDRPAEIFKKILAKFI